MSGKSQNESLILFRYRGRALDESSLHIVQSVISRHWHKGRSYIARVLCEMWQWHQPNGALKEFACRDFLLRLEEAGLVTLPPRKKMKNNLKMKDFSRTPIFNDHLLFGSVSQFDDFVVRPVADRSERYLCDWLIHKYHYLGYCPPVGEHFKYLAFLEGQPVSCIIWASASWKSIHRRRFIGWNDDQKRAHLHLVVNNVRFLILPWVKVKCLASKVLSANCRRLCSDWKNRWNHPIVLAETFIDTTLFKGTCYRAANWIFLGHTKGSAKRGASYYNHGNPKALYVYPVHRHFRNILC